MFQSLQPQNFLLQPIALTQWNITWPRNSFEVSLLYSLPCFLKQCPTFSLRPLDKVKSTVFKNLTENKTTIFSLLSRHFYYCVADEAGSQHQCLLYPHPGYTYHITRDMCAGIHISRGYTYHCDTGNEHFTPLVIRDI